MAKPLGTLMVNEVPFAVERIWLEGGEVRFWCSRPGPVDAHVSDFCVLFGPDGVEVMRGDTEINIPAMDVDGWVHIDLPFAVIGKEAASA